MTADAGNLHFDSKHRWLNDGRWHGLIVILDDATRVIYYAQPVEEESTRTGGWKKGEHGRRENQKQLVPASSRRQLSTSRAQAHWKNNEEHNFDSERGTRCQMLNQMVDEKPNVWVVDDDANTCSSLSDFLSSKGYEVQCLNSGEHVLARLESAQRPSLLILDIRMPGVDGLEVLAEMDRLGRRIPAIMLSGVTQVNTVVKAMWLGATDYLAKPLNEQELELAVERALEESGWAAEV